MNIICKTSDALNIIIAMVTSAFIVISVVAVLSDNSRLVLWENTVYSKLIKPRILNLTFLTYMVFTLVCIGLMCFKMKRYNLEFCFFIVEIFILMLLISRTMNIYFGSDMRRRKLKKKFISLSHNSKNAIIVSDCAEQLYYNIYEKVKQGNYDRLNDDISFLLIATNIIKDDNLYSMTCVRLKEIMDMNESVITNSFHLVSGHFAAKYCIDGEEKLYRKAVIVYSEMMLTRFSNDADQIFKLAVNNLDEKSRICDSDDSIRISERNERKYINPCEDKSVYSGNSSENEQITFLDNEPVLLYLNTKKYKEYPVLVKQLIDQIGIVLSEEIKFRYVDNTFYDENGYPKVYSLYFRKFPEYEFCLFDNRVISEFESLISVYEKDYLSADYEKLKILEYCIVGILWIFYMQGTRQMSCFNMQVIKYYAIPNLPYDCEISLYHEIQEYWEWYWANIGQYEQEVQDTFYAHEKLDEDDIDYMRSMTNTKEIS